MIPLIVFFLMLAAVAVFLLWPLKQQQRVEEEKPSATVPYVHIRTAREEAILSLLRLTLDKVKEGEYVGLCYKGDDYHYVGGHTKQSFTFEVNDILFIITSYSWAGPSVQVEGWSLVEPVSYNGLDAEINAILFAIVKRLSEALVEKRRREKAEREAQELSRIYEIKKEIGNK